MATKVNRKRTYEKAVPLNLTFMPVIREAIDELVEEGGFKGPADFFSDVVRARKGLPRERAMDRVAA